MASLSGSELPILNGIWLQPDGYRTLLLTRKLVAALELILLPSLGDADETTLIG
jgi:hypothetical protein